METTTATQLKPYLQQLVDQGYKLDTQDDSRIINTCIYLVKRRGVWYMNPDLCAHLVIDKDLLQKHDTLKAALEELQSYKFPAIAKGAKISRNAPCPCGSDKKVKKCCTHLLIR